MSEKQIVKRLVFHITPRTTVKMAYMGPGCILVENQSSLYTPLVIFLLYPLQKCSI